MGVEVMKIFSRIIADALLIVAAGWIAGADVGKVDGKSVLTGQAAFADYRSIKPGQFHKITADDLPKPFETKSTANPPLLAAKPENMWPQAPAGFRVELYASGLGEPRQIRTAPNGDLFVADSHAGEIQIFRGRGKDGKPEQVSTFATGMKRPFGVNFYPPGVNPQWVYVGNTDSVVRLPYKNGDLKPSGPAEKLVTDLPAGGYHWTRDLVFSKDGKRLFVAVGSGSNIDDPDTHQSEFHRADILEYTPEGKFVGVYASGIRNPVGLGVNPQTGELWCSVNERDELGDRLPPDYITHVQQGGFYGWPFYYIGGHADPRLGSAHPELKDKVIVPDVLVQAHNASLGLTFYDGSQFPKEYSGDLFAAEHGSWNRAIRGGYEVVRVPLENGHASGVYEDFLTGFVTPEGNAWGRPVGVAVAKDGSIYVTDDGYKAIWRVSYTGK
jgi:glucose/arabinose dehydrogenase